MLVFRGVSKVSIVEEKLSESDWIRVTIATLVMSGRLEFDFDSNATITARLVQRNGETYTGATPHGGGIIGTLTALLRSLPYKSHLLAIKPE